MWDRLRWDAGETSVGCDCPIPRSLPEGRKRRRDFPVFAVHIPPLSLRPPRATGPCCRAAAPRRWPRNRHRDSPQPCSLSRPLELGRSWEGGFLPLALTCRDTLAEIILEIVLKRKEGGKERQESERERRGEHSASLLGSAASRRVKWRQIMP